MNRNQAENILDAYYVTVKVYGDDAAAAKSLREVILDAMTSSTYNHGTLRTPNGITIGSPWRGEAVPCSYPTNWDGTPKVTCTGIDPMFGHTTSASTVYANGHTQEAVE